MHAFIDKLSICLVIAEIKPGIAPSIPLIRELNRNASQLLGYQTQDLIGQPLDTLTAPGQGSEVWRSALNQLADSPSSVCFQVDLLNHRQQSFPALLTLSRLQENTDHTASIAVFIQDIDSSIQRENDLLLMHMAVEQSASAVVITDPHGCIEYVNPKFCQMTGYSKQEILGHSPRILQSGSTSVEQYQILWQNLLELGEWRGEIKNQKKNGEYYWAYESISAIKNNVGKITHLLAVEEDITERKHFEAALKESEERFRQMAEMTGEWLWEQNPEGFYIYSSNAVKTIVGYTPEEVIGKHYTSLLTLQDKTEFIPYATQQKPFYALVNHYRHKDGHSVIAESTGLPIIDDNGRLVKWRGVDHDITARKHYEDALIESEKRTRLIIETALNAIVIMDSYGIITDWNPQAEAMFGWTREEAIDRNMAELIIPKRLRRAHYDGLRKFLNSGESKVLNKLTEQVALRKDGTEFPVELSITPLKIGNAYEFSGFIHDISERKKAERQIRQAQVNLAIAQSEIKIAQQIQSSLFPDQPILSPEFEITGFCLPAAQVGGDYFDYFYRDEHHLDMIIADVSGHAVGPALFMVETRSAIRTQANWLGTPAQIVEVLNKFLFQDLNNANHFLTLFYLQYNPDTKTLSYTNAGHPMPLLYCPATNECHTLDADGLIIGIQENVTFEAKEVRVSPGDCLLLYTDGLTEAESPQGDFFGTERLQRVFSEIAQREPNGIIEEIVRQLKRFCQTETFNDDVTMVVFKLR